MHFSGPIGFIVGGLNRYLVLTSDVEPIQRFRLWVRAWLVHGTGYHFQQTPKVGPRVIRPPLPSYNGSFRPAFFHRQQDAYREGGAALWYSTRRGSVAISHRGTLAVVCLTRPREGVFPFDFLPIGPTGCERVVWFEDGFVPFLRVYARQVVVFRLLPTFLRDGLGFFFCGLLSAFELSSLRN